MNNILITGGTGFLGNIIYNTLKDTNNVFTLSRNSVNYKCDLTKEIPEFNKLKNKFFHPFTIPIGI